MRRSKVLLDFIKLSVGEKIAFFRNVIILMTNNLLFPKPDVTLEVLTPMVDKLENDYAASRSGSHAMVMVMRQAEQVADNAFRKLAMYVDRTADGDPAIILKSGFNISKQPEPANRDSFIVEAGENPTEIVLTRKAQPGAKSYVWQYRSGALPGTDQSWVFAGFSTQTRFVVKGLESGSKYWFRVAAITINGTGPWSEPVMKMVL